MRKKTIAFLVAAAVCICDVLPAGAELLSDGELLTSYETTEEAAASRQDPSVPEEPAAEQADSGEAAPQEAVQEQTASEENVQEEQSPEKDAQEQTAPEETVQEETSAETEDLPEEAEGCSDEAPAEELTDGEEEPEPTDDLPETYAEEDPGTAVPASAWSVTGGGYKLQKSAEENTWYTAEDGIVKISTDGHSGRYLFDEDGFMVTGVVSIAADLPGNPCGAACQVWFADKSEAICYDQAAAEALTPADSTMGQLQTARWRYQDGAFSYFNADGAFTPVSALAEPVKNANGYFEIDGKCYALADDGKPKTGLVKLGTYLYYYFQEDTVPAGQMFMGGWKMFSYAKGDKWFYFAPESAGADKGKGDFPHVQRLVRIPAVSKNFDVILDHNNYIKKNIKTKVNGKTYVVPQSGLVYRYKLVKKGKNRYFVGGDGSVVNWKNCWHKVNNSVNTYYYFGNTPGLVVEKKGFQAVTNASGKFLFWEYFNNSGNPLRNQFMGRRYFRNDGRMASGILTVDGVPRFFQVSTASAANGEYLDCGLFKHNNRWYYATPGTGALVKNGWVTINGSPRCFENYCMVTNAFRAYNGRYGYLNGDGVYITGWVTVNDKQNLVRYINPNAPGYYTNTWATINGLQYYFDGNGYRKNDVSGMVKGPYMVKVDRVNCVATVYNAAGTIPVRSMRISPGAAGTPTPAGTYTLQRSGRWQALMGPSWGQYGTHVVGAGRGGIFFHSIPCSSPGIYNVPSYPYNILGIPASHGCIRCCVADAKFIYDYCNGARCVIFSGTYTASEAFKGPLGRPALVPKTSGADPTDPLR